MLKTKMQTGLPAYIEGESTTSYTYNMVGQRVQRNTPSLNEKYVYDCDKYEYNSSDYGIIDKNPNSVGFQQYQ